MVRLSGVSKWFAGQSRVLDHIDLELKQGDFLYVVGGTGAGKSSLLRLLATEEYASAGAVSLFGYDLKQVSPANLRSIRRTLGYVPQNVRLIPDLSVQENIAIAATLAGRKSIGGAELKRRLGELLDRLGLAAKRDKPGRAISGGEAQRVAVARALIRNPDLIVADEPTGAQDADHTWGVMDLLVRANSGGATVVVATHDREIVRRVRRPCAVLRDGRVSIEGGPLCVF